MSHLRDYNISITHSYFNLSFFSDVRRLGEPNYIPNEADVLRARLKSTGIAETRFNMGQLSIQYVNQI